MQMRMFILTAALMLLCVLSGVLVAQPYRVNLEKLFESNAVYDEDFADIKGQEQAKRAVEVAVAKKTLVADEVNKK